LANHIHFERGDANEQTFADRCGHNDHTRHDGITRLYLALSHDNGVLKLAGVVEVFEIRLGSKIGGRVAQVYVLEGQEVEAGADLIRFDVPELEAQKVQLTNRLAGARADSIKPWPVRGRKKKTKRGWRWKWPRPDAIARNTAGARKKKTRPKPISTAPNRKSIWRGRILSGSTSWIFK